MSATISAWWTSRSIMAAATRIKRDVADLVDDQQRDPLQPDQLVIQATLALRVG